MSNSMKRLEFGALKDIRIQIGGAHETSLRYTRARSLEALGADDRAKVAKILGHRPKGSYTPLWQTITLAIEALAIETRDDKVTNAPAATPPGVLTQDKVDLAIRMAKEKLGDPDREEGRRLSTETRSVYSWASGELLAFESAGDRLWRDVTDAVLDDLDAAEEGESMFDAPPAKQAAVMCGICSHDVGSADSERATWPTGSGVVVHLACRQGEIDRRNAKGIYGTAEQMREELAKRGRPVGEVWDIAELEQLILAARRETDEIDWAKYETRSAGRKQGRPCLVCGEGITKGQEYKQASRGRKAHHACVAAEAATAE